MSDQQQHKVYVTGLPVDISTDDLRKDFQKFGQIVDVYIKQRDTFAFAFITYESMPQAKEAIEQMNGSNFKGKRLKLDLAKPRNNNRAYSAGPRDNNDRSRGGDRPRVGSKACFKCNEQGHFARECPNGDKRGTSDNRGANDNRGNYNSSRRQQSPSPKRQSRKKSQSKSNSPQKKHQKKSVSRSISRSPQKRITRKKSPSPRSRSRSPAKGKNQKKRSFSRSSSLKKEKESRSRSRSRSIDNKNKRRTVKRRSPSASSRSRS